jgi:spore maturation protein A
MNILFTLLFLICSLALLFTDASAFLPTVLEGASAAASLCVALLASYAVWLGLMQVWEDSGLSRLLSKWLKPLARKLFRTDDEETLTAVCMNLSANMLGIGGAATPYGIRAAQALDKTKNAEFSSCMLFVVNATSVQLIPTSIIGIRAALGSGNPTDVVLPVFLATLFSTGVGILLTFLFLRDKKRPTHVHKKDKKRGAGTK